MKQIFQTFPPCINKKSVQTKGKYQRCITFDSIFRKILSIHKTLPLVYTYSSDRKIPKVELSLMVFFKKYYLQKKPYLYVCTYGL